MDNQFSFSTIPFGKLIGMPKENVNLENIQAFLKELGIKRDYRKNFLKTFPFDDQTECSSTKDGDVVVSAFVTKNKLYLQVFYTKEELEEPVLKLVSKYFA